MKKIKLLFFLITGMFFNLYSQDGHHEYGILRYQGSTNSVIKSYLITVSTESKTTKFEGKVTEMNANLNLSPLVAKMSELSKEGWEVYSTSSSSDSDANIILYHIRRKSEK
jgi:hypothetical protein